MARLTRLVARAVLFATLLGSAARAEHQSQNFLDLDLRRVCVDQVRVYRDEKRSRGNEAALLDVMVDGARRSGLPFNLASDGCLAHARYVVDTYVTNAGFHLYSFELTVYVNGVGTSVAYTDDSDDPVRLRALFSNVEIWRSGEYGYADGFATVMRRAEQSLRDLFSELVDEIEHAEDETDGDPEDYTWRP